MGNKESELLRPHEHNPPVHAELEATLHEPSLYDEFIRYLHRRGAPVPEHCVERDFAQQYEPAPELVDVFRTIYEDPHTYWDEYEMCEKLVDLEERFRLWRFRHVMTVQRVIGFKRGTGGSSGVDFLWKRLQHTYFPELWDVRTHIRDIEQLPATAVNPTPA
jgi:tryptophan 2,3-dioxygenase